MLKNQQRRKKKRTVKPMSTKRHGLIKQLTPIKKKINQVLMHLKTSQNRKPLPLHLSVKYAMVSSTSMVRRQATPRIMAQVPVVVTSNVLPRHSSSKPLLGKSLLQRNLLKPVNLPMVVVMVLRRSLTVLHHRVVTLSPLVTAVLVAVVLLLNQNAGSSKLLMLI